MSDSFVPQDLTEWTTQARRDDWHMRFVGSDIRCMLAEIERLRDAQRWRPIETGMERPAEPILLGFWYQGKFKQYIAEYDPAGWMEQGKRTFYPSHMQGWFTHWQPLPAPPQI